jgi:hypothetical protein
VLLTRARTLTASAASAVARTALTRVPTPGG